MSFDPPIIIPCFNNPTYVRNMLAQLQVRNLSNITLIDSNSSYPEMIEFLENIKKDLHVVRLSHNKGPHYFSKNWLFYLKLPKIFCVTDPDIRFNSAMPMDFIEVLRKATDEFAIGKAGLALDISDMDKMRPDHIMHRGKEYTIWDWEAQFWQHQISATNDGDPIYRATIDTTFAVYNKSFFRRKNFERAIRFAGRFTAQHLPWYRDNLLPEEEERFYRATGHTHSWYFRMGKR